MALVSRVLLFTALLAPTAAQVSLPAAGTPRFVDYSATLAHPGSVVVLGTLTKWKEGRRERLADGQLGGSGQVVSVSGTQYFAVPVTATLAPRAVLHGDADGVKVTFDVQLARLPDGKERRQFAGGMPLEADRLALLVIVPRAKKGHELRHVIVHEPAAGAGADAEAVFADTMRDVHAVNRRMQALTAALARVDEAKDEPARAKAVATLREVLAAKVELKLPKHDSLLVQHVGPLERRAEQRLAAAGASSEPKGGG